MKLLQAKRPDRPIIESLLDIDFYKFTMGQYIHEYDPDTIVTFKLINRTTSVRLADLIPVEELRAELNHVMSLRFNRSELYYLRGIDAYGRDMFHVPYIDFLKTYQAPAFELAVNQETGQFDLTFTCRWAEATYWETLAIAIVVELYTYSQLKGKTAFETESIVAEGIVRLREKIAMLRKYPRLTFCDFGTRRRLSKAWHHHVVEILANELPSSQFIGTSNTLLANQLGLLPMGTSAHEIPMVRAAKESDPDRIRASHREGLQDWWELYGYGLSIALTDTFGTDFFFRDFPEEMAQQWKGLRQDSGDPFAFGEKALAFYASMGVDPTEELLVFSDGLDMEKMVNLHRRFENRIRTTFGWGTHLTNDVGLPTISLVCKVVAANGLPAVKLSDNIEKATGDPATVAKYAEIFDYHNTWREVPTV